MEVITVSIKNYEELLESYQHEREKNDSLQAVVKRLKQQLADKCHEIIELKRVKP